MIASLIVAILLGLGIAYFAVQNIHEITITLANYPVNLPVYMIVIGSILVGLVVSFVFSLIDTFSSKMALHGKDASLNSAQKTIQELRRENKQLQLENARLAGQKKTEEKQYPRYSVFDRLRGNV